MYTGKKAIVTLYYTTLRNTTLRYTSLRCTSLRCRGQAGQKRKQVDGPANRPGAAIDKLAFANRARQRKRPPSGSGSSMELAGSEFFSHKAGNEYVALQ